MQLFPNSVLFPDDKIYVAKITFGDRGWTIVKDFHQLSDALESFFGDDYLKPPFKDLDWEDIIMEEKITIEWMHMHKSEYDALPVDEDGDWNW